MNNNNTVSSEINNTICEAAKCYAKATTEIEIKLGQRGVISLRLCKDCVNKFEDQESK